MADLEEVRLVHTNPPHHDLRKKHSVCNIASASTPTRWLVKGEWLMQFRSRGILYAITSRSAILKSGSPAGQDSLDRLWKRAKEQSGVI